MLTGSAAVDIMAGTSLRSETHRSRLGPRGSSKACLFMPGRYAIHACRTSADIFSDRAGMHLLFYGKEQIKLLEGGTLDGVLKEKSVKVSSPIS